MRGLVLEGGGIKGSYQIGAFYALKKCGIKFDGFVGASIGSFNAAMLACNKYKELFDLWYNLDLSKVLGINEEFLNDYNTNKKSLKTFKEAFGEVGGVIKNRVIKYEGLMDLANDMVKFEDLQKSKKDFGLTTVQVSRNGFRPKYVYKNQIRNQKELTEYIMASCYFPGIKQRRIIDDHFYIDGGFYDVSPTRMFLDRNYDEVYIINVKGIGIHRRLKNVDAKIVNIKPSRPTGLVFELDKSITRDNILMGYYDTLRLVKHLDGYRYCFKPRDKNYYKYITRKVDERLVKRVMNFFRTKSIKIACIKAMEYVLETEHVSYYKVYNIFKLSKNYRNKKKNSFIYKFISGWRFFF